MPKLLAVDANTDRGTNLGVVKWRLGDVEIQVTALPGAKNVWFVDVSLSTKMLFTLAMSLPAQVNAPSARSVAASALVSTLSTCTSLAAGAEPQ